MAGDAYDGIGACNLKARNGEGRIKEPRKLSPETFSIYEALNVQPNSTSTIPVHVTRSLEDGRGLIYLISCINVRLRAISYLLDLVSIPCATSTVAAELSQIDSVSQLESCLIGHLKIDLLLGIVIHSLKSA